jgi:hypothetical protein
VVDFQHERADFQNYLSGLRTIWDWVPWSGEGHENTAPFIQSVMDAIQTMCNCRIICTYCSNIRTEREDSLAAIQPPNKLITRRWLVPARMQMFPCHGPKVKSVELVTVASHCFLSIQPQIPCRVQCNKQQSYMKGSTDSILQRSVPQA